MALIVKEKLRNDIEKIIKNPPVTLGQAGRKIRYLTVLYFNLAV